jgi:hypothetical protein
MDIHWIPAACPKVKWAMANAMQVKTKFLMLQYRKE